MNLLYTLDLLGTAAFAASGALAGVRRNMDLFGVLVLGLVTATGGGTIRDLLLGDTPPFIFKDETYLYLSLCVSVAVFIFHRNIDRFHHPLLYCDAVGLGTFVVIGTSKAIAFHIGFFGSIMMGVMTATAGGMVRDMLSTTCHWCCKGRFMPRPVWQAPHFSICCTSLHCRGTMPR